MCRLGVNVIIKFLVITRGAKLLTTVSGSDIDKIIVHTFRMIIKILPTYSGFAGHQRERTDKAEKIVSLTIIHTILLSSITGYISTAFIGNLSYHNMTH